MAFDNRFVSNYCKRRRSSFTQLLPSRPSTKSMRLPLGRSSGSNTFTVECASSRRLQDHVHLVLLVWIERRSAQRFCNAEDASERCADFHADVGKEFSACIVGLDGFIAGFDQLMRLFAQLLGAADRLPLRLVLLVRQRIEINQKDDHQEAESEQLRLVRMQQQIEGKPPRCQAGRGNRSSAVRSRSVPTA